MSLNRNNHDNHTTPNKGKSLMLAEWAKAGERKIDKQAIVDMEWVKGIILAVRNLRAEMNLKPSKPLPLLLHNTTPEDRRRLQENHLVIQKLANLESIQLTGDEELPMTSMRLVGQMEVHLPLAGVIDKDAEISRMDKEIERMEKDIQRTAGKLNSESFVSKAPTEVVDKEKAKLAEAKTARNKLKEQKQQLQAL